MSSVRSTTQVGVVGVTSERWPRRRLKTGNEKRCNSKSMPDKVELDATEERSPKERVLIRVS